VFSQQEQEENAKRCLAAALAFEGMPTANLHTHPFLHRLIVDSIAAAEYVLEEGYDPEELDRESYVLARDEDGKIVVQLLSE